MGTWVVEDYRITCRDLRRPCGHFLLLPPPSPLSCPHLMSLLKLFWVCGWLGVKKKGGKKKEISFLPFLVIYACYNFPIKSFNIIKEADGQTVVSVQKMFLFVTTLTHGICLLPETFRQPAPLTTSSSQPRSKQVKIVFVLTLNGRQVRQVVRLLRTIYHPHHYYYIHVDSVSEAYCSKSIFTSTFTCLWQIDMNLGIPGQK